MNALGSAFCRNFMRISYLAEAFELLKEILV